MDWMAGAARRGGAAGTGAEGIGQRGRAPRRGDWTTGTGRGAGKLEEEGRGKAREAAREVLFAFQCKHELPELFTKKRPRLGEIVAFGASWRSKNC
jgi:hypothetical protein